MPWRFAFTWIVIVESCNVKGFRSSSAELKPHWRHQGQFGAKHLGNVIAMGIPLKGGKMYDNTGHCLWIIYSTFSMWQVLRPQRCHQKAEKLKSSSGECGLLWMAWRLHVRTYRCDISQHWSLKCSLDMSRISFFLLHYVFPVQVWHNKASFQHWQLSWRCLECDQRKRNISVTVQDKGFFLRVENSGESGDIPGRQTWHILMGVKLLTSVSALWDFLASVLESVARTAQLHEMMSSRNNVVLISKKDGDKEFVKHLNKTGLAQISWFAAQMFPFWLICSKLKTSRSFSGLEWHGTLRETGPVHVSKTQNLNLW